MIRFTILLLTFSILAKGQDSTLVQETCKKISELSDPDDILEQANIVGGQLITLAPAIESTPNDRRVKTIYTFQYKLHRELLRTCPKYLIREAPKAYHRVIDFEDKLTRAEIDSLTNLCGKISKQKDIYVYIVTIDDYFPDKNIADFANRNREYWGNLGSWEKGIVMIAVSVANHEIRISTSEISLKYLSDQKCAEIIKLIIPSFKQGKYYNGLVTGLNGILSSL